MKAELLADLRQRILSAGGIDIEKYKQEIILRRLENRIKKARCSSPTEYLNRVKYDPVELHRLTRALTVKVSSFFREPFGLTLLENNIMDQILARKSRLGANLIKVWCAGCSEGEEAYTLAIIFHRVIKKHKSFQIALLATDVDSSAIKSAIKGEFSSRAVAKLSPDVIETFFDPVPNGYRVKPFLKEMVHFRTHDLLNDPPGRLYDCIVCRNVMIYLKRDVQEDLMVRFCRLLKTEGYLILGRAEPLLGQARKMFTTISLKGRIYQKKPFPLMQEPGNKNTLIPHARQDPDIEDSTTK